MGNRAWPFRLALTLLLVAFVAVFVVGCATKGFVRQETQKSAATLSTRIDSSDKAIQQNTEQIRANSNQIGELVSLNKQNTQRIETVNGEVQKTDGKAVQARTAADQAQQAANKANEQVVVLDGRFTGRNNYQVVTEKVVYFKLDSAALDSAYSADLTAAAEMAKSNPDAVVVVEGRADGSGDADYNIRLGERRMDAVVRFLVVDQGVPMHKVHKMSFGSANPVADNSTRDGRAKNRCAIVRVLAPAGSRG
jgi:outer membrane protein OmpA-like peptidoglycan-associated protein